MKTVCIYHSIDLDGFMSAAIVKHWWNMEIKHQGDTLDFIGYNYGQPIPDLSEYDKVIMCDISFPNTHMLKLANKLGVNFTWIDHHQPKINELTKYLVENYAPTIDGLITREGEQFAACELTWKYFFPNEQMPEIVRLLGLYYSFRYKGTDEEQKVLEFQYGARQCINNHEEAYRYLRQSLTIPIEIIKQIHDSGKSIYQYLCTEAKQVYKNGFDIKLGSYFNTKDGVDKYKFICINKERFNPINFGIDYHKDGYDGVASFCYDGVAKVWRFSLYNDNGLVDCSVIAKQFGGGEHKGASGFILNNDEFFKLIIK